MELKRQRSGHPLQTAVDMQRFVLTLGFVHSTTTTFYSTLLSKDTLKDYRIPIITWYIEKYETKRKENNKSCFVSWKKGEASKVSFLNFLLGLFCARSVHTFLRLVN